MQPLRDTVPTDVEKVACVGADTQLDRQCMLSAIDRLGADLRGGRVLRKRHNGAVVRFQLHADRSVVIKLWSRQGAIGFARRAAGLTSSQREVRMLKRLSRNGLRVPVAYGCCNLPRRGQEFVDVLFMEDLGVASTATEHVKALIGVGELARLEAFEERLLDITEAMLAAGVVDVDHGLINTIAVESEPVRIDFEAAKYVARPRAAVPLYARMLGHLCLTYAFAVQPDMRLAEAFSSRVVERLRPSKAVLIRAQEYVQKHLSIQRQRGGPDMTLHLRWAR